MAMRWGSFTRPDGSTHRQIEIAERSDWSYFERVADILVVGLAGTWIDRIDGLDERYWDLAAGSGRVTLHLQHHLGITLYATTGMDSDAASRKLLDEAYTLLLAHSPR
jgi:cellulase/cellobiase CelA1